MVYHLVNQYYGLIRGQCCSQHLYYNSRVLTRGTFPARRFCGCGLERGSAQDPPLRTPTGTPTGALTETLTAAQKVLQQRWYFSEPLVAR